MELKIEAIPEYLTHYLNHKKANWTKLVRTFNEKLNRNSVFCSSTFSFKPQGFTQSPGVSEDVFFQTLRNKSERGTGGFITGEEERRDGARGEIC